MILEIVMTMMILVLRKLLRGLEQVMMMLVLELKIAFVVLIHIFEWHLNIVFSMSRVVSGCSSERKCQSR